MVSNSRHLFITQLHNNLAKPEARVQASGALEQLHVESNSECNRHVYPH